MQRGRIEAVVIEEAVVPKEVFTSILINTRGELALNT